MMHPNGWLMMDGGQRDVAGWSVRPYGQQLGWGPASPVTHTVLYRGGGGLQARAPGAPEVERGTLDHLLAAYC